MARNPAFTPLVAPTRSLTSAYNAARNALYTPPKTVIDSLNSTTLWPDPLQPITPMMPAGAEPLSWPFEWGQNIDYTPRANSEYSAKTLRQLSMYPLARVCIENSKDMVSGMPHRIQLKPLPGETSKDRAKRSKGDTTLVMLNKFFDQPNDEQDWQMFIRPLLEDMLVIDGASIFIGRNPKSGKVRELRWVEGASITRLVDEHGWTPSAPNPAYQQLWEGWPRVNLTTQQLVYRPRNIVPRGEYSSNPSSFLYGCSPTEQMAPEIKIGWERLRFVYNFYACYSEDTEILCRNKGWVLFKDLELTDEIATRNPDTKAFEWQRPSKITNTPYSGEMYKCKSNTFDFLVTPNHRMLVARRSLRKKNAKCFRNAALDFSPILVRQITEKRAEFKCYCGNLFIVPRSAKQKFCSKKCLLSYCKENYVIADDEPNEIFNESIQIMEELATSDTWGKHHTETVTIPVTSEWEGIPVETKIFNTVHAEFASCAYTRTLSSEFYAGMRGVAVQVPASKKRASRVEKIIKPIVMTGDEYCAFMGAYLSEGWCMKSSSGYEVSICQLEKSKGFIPYKNLLTGILGKEPAYRGCEFKISRKALYEHVKQFGQRSYVKFIPEEIMNATKKQLKIFWDYYVLGNGSTEYYKVDSKRKSSVPEAEDGTRRRDSIVTSSKRMADQLVEIAQKLGWSASSRTYPAGTKSGFLDINGNEQLTKRDLYTVVPSYTKYRSFRITKEQYSGNVVCATVPNGILYVRRKGKPVWCGNSGSIPGAIHFAPPGTPPEKIKEAQEYLDATYAGNLQRRRQWQIFQGWQKDGHPEQYVFPKEPTLADLFDEVHTRKICFAFGTSPQRLMRQMNRASAATAQTAAEEEGTIPWMKWLKSVIDYIIQEILGYPEYEFAFDPFHELDVMKQAQADASDVKNGLYTRNEKREQRGDDPRPEPEADELSVMTAQGAIPLGQIASPVGAQDRGTRSSAKTAKPNGYTTFTSCPLHKDQYPREFCESCNQGEKDTQNYERSVTREGRVMPSATHVRKYTRAVDFSRLM